MYIRNLLEAQYGPASRWLQETSLKPIVGCKFGLELEVEGSSIPRAHTIIPYWQTITDGSLRALPEALEYKTLPLSIEGIKKALDIFEDSAKSSTFKPSIRTSTHLHINVQDMTITQVANFIAIYLLLEGSLYEICGKHRRGNVFCIPLTQCDDILRRFGRLCKQQHQSNLRNLSGDGDKYAALSLRSMYYYGTLEVRTHEGVSEKELNRVYNWTNIFKGIREYALKEGVDPIYILQTASNMGPEDFTKMFLGEEFNMVDTQSFWDGVSSIQYFATSSDWKPEEPLNLKETPDIEPKKPSKKKTPNVDTDFNNLNHLGSSIRFNFDETVNVARGVRRNYDRAANMSVLNVLYRADHRALVLLREQTGNHFGLEPFEVVMTHMDHYLHSNRMNVVSLLSDYDIAKYIQLSDGARLSYMGIQLSAVEDTATNPAPDGLFDRLTINEIINSGVRPTVNFTGGTVTTPVISDTIRTRDTADPTFVEIRQRAEEAVRRVRTTMGSDNRIRVQEVENGLVRDLDNLDDGED